MHFIADDTADPAETFMKCKSEFASEWMRGEIFDFNGTSVFAFGGTRSHDIAVLASDEELERDYTAGILQKDDLHLYGKLKMVRNYYSSARIENHNWWRAMPTQDETDCIRKNTKNIKKLSENLVFRKCESGAV